MGTGTADHEEQEFVKEKVLEHVPRQPSIDGILVPIISRTQGCTYEAMEYFVAWQGVLTIAYTGIPSSIIQLKQEVRENLKGLSEENYGSKWPKTTIGCLQDEKILSLDQLKKVKQICSEESPALATTEPVIVDNLSVVLYENRRLEKIITEATIPLAMPINTSKPSEAEKAHVRGVVDEFAEENLHKYHEWTSKPGHRSTHYLMPVLEAALVYRLKTAPAALSRFRTRVDAELPDMYEWFADNSLHITVRALW